MIQDRTSYIPNGLLLQWHITNRCNLRCAHCYQPEYGGEERPLSDLLEVLRQFEDLLTRWRASREMPVSGQITVTGGEPFARRDFFDLLKAFAARADQFTFAVLSNGVLIDRPRAHHLAELHPRFVQVSLEGKETTHDRIRGKGNYRRVIAGVRELTKAGVRTFIAFTAHRENFREFPDVAQLGRELGVSRVWADRLIPSGSGAQLAAAMLSPGETKEFIELIRHAQNEARCSQGSGTEIAAHRALQFLVAGGQPYRCTAGDTLLTVMPNGDLYPCRRMPVRVGNVFERPLADLYYDSDLLQRLRNPANTSNECSGCCFNRLCRGGLKCLAYAIYQDPFRADPGCWLAHCDDSRQKQKRIAAAPVTTPVVSGGSIRPSPA